ncbi:MAG: VOC family protein [Chloroflexi bacterium]|nr:VOC family protein [Chloroflexota bacterium]
MFTRIHHVGLVVGDLEAARRLWADVYGFPVTGYGVRVDENRTFVPHGREVSQKDVTILDVAVGGTELEFNEPRDPESGTSRYLARRGPGLHHLSLATNDLERDVARLQAGGLQLIVPPVGHPEAKEGARIAFFHPKDNLGVLLELWQDTPAQGVAPACRRGRGGGLTRLHHVGVVAPSIPEARHLLEEVYGLRLGAHCPPEGRYAAFDHVRALDFPVGETEIEVVVPQDSSSGTARFLASRGPGLHHLCLSSEDIEEDMGRLKGAGLQEVGKVGPGALPGVKVGWLHPRSNLGVLVELWQDVGGGV